MNNVLSCKKLEFGRDRALTPPLDWEVNSGEFWAVVGPNGCGKSTLIDTILGILPAFDGTYERTRSCSHVAQIPDETNTAPARVVDVVSIGLERGLSWLIPFHRHKYAAQIDIMLDTFELTSLKQRQFSELSPGERQRVLLAQALVGSPELIVLDEAASAMDPVHAKTTMAQLARIASQNNIAVIAITHHLDTQIDAVSHILRFTPGGFECEKQNHDGNASKPDSTKNISIVTQMDVPSALKEDII